MTAAKSLVVLAFAGAAIQANASVITLQTGCSTAGAQASANAYRDVVDVALVAQAKAGT